MSFQTVAIKEVQANPFRNAESYEFNQEKINGLKESIADTSFWENLLARKNKDGVIQLAYGHHRLEALKQLVAEGMDQYESIKLNVRSYTELSDERMLKILAQENKDDWRDTPQNLCMTILQIRQHLENILKVSKDAEDFAKRAGGALKVDARSYARFKNQGIGASTIAQFLGDTWSRQTIQDTLQLLEAGEQSENLRKLAEKLPSVTLANRYQKLVTKEVSGKGDTKTVELFPNDVQDKVQKAILANALTRADVEEAIKLSSSYEEGPDPVKAIKQVADKVKEERKAKKEAEKALAGESSPGATKTPIEQIGKYFDQIATLVRANLPVFTDKDLKAIDGYMKTLVAELKNRPKK